MSVNVQRRKIMTNVLLSLAAVYGLKLTIMGDFNHKHVSSDCIIDHYLTQHAMSFQDIEIVNNFLFWSLNARRRYYRQC